MTAARHALAASQRTLEFGPGRGFGYRDDGQEIAWRREVEDSNRSFYALQLITTVIYHHLGHVLSIIRLVIG
jgi:hypothetical protein